MADIRYINGKAFLSSKDAAQRFGVSTATIAKRCKAGSLDAQKVHGAWYVRADACPAASSTASVASPSKPSKTSKKNGSPKPTKTIQPRVIVTLKKEYVAERLKKQSTPKSVRALIPSTYVSLFSIPVGALLLIGIFSVGTLPFMSQSLATLSRIDQPMFALLQGANQFQTRVSVKTNELAHQNMAAASLGFSSLTQQLENLKREPKDKPSTVRARPSMLARATSEVAHTSFRKTVVETGQSMAAALMSLYRFEAINTSIAHTTNSTWGCTFGFGTCPTKDPVPLRGITVYDIETKRIHCLQVSNGEPTSTPGRCDLEDRK
jgi:hypothetical protein